MGPPCRQPALTPGPPATAAPGPDEGRAGSVPFRLGHRRWLDGLRGWAILIVFVYHLGLLPGGFLGVDVFFVLSGFLITALLMEEWQRAGRISLRQFWLRRALRLFPALAGLLIAWGLLTAAFRPEHLAAYAKEALVAACYVANWPLWHQTAMPTLGHSWSLSLEEQFYLLWPLILVGLLLAGLRGRRLAAVIALAIVAFAAHRLALHRQFRAEGGSGLWAVTRLYMGLDARADALLVGCLVGVLAVSGRLPRSRRAVFLAGGVALASVLLLAHLILTRHLGHPQLYDGLFTVVALGVGAILVRLLAAPSRLGQLLLESAPLVWLGRLSYSVYLVHIPIRSWLCPEGVDGRLPDCLLMTALTLAAAVLSYYCIERPCLRLKDRLRPPAVPPMALPVATAPRAAA